MGTSRGSDGAVHAALVRSEARAVPPQGRARAFSPAPSQDEKYRTPRRIAIVLPNLGAGGTERVVNVIANEWAARGWTVTVITLQQFDGASYYDYHPAVTIRRLGLPNTGRRSRRSLLRRLVALRAALRGARPDLIISFLSRTNVLTLAASRGLGVPVVISERNNPALQDIGPAWRWLRARLYPRAYGLVTMTQGVLDYFPKRMRNRGWVIPNPAYLPVGWTEKRGGKILTAVGRLVEQKGFDMLLSAFARAAADRPDWKLVIWGEGPQRMALEQQRDALGLKDRVLMPGLSERPGLWIETADAFVLSSRYEGWGIVLLEAMAAGLPVISFDCQWGPREMIEDGVDGLLVPREDVDALAAALADVMSDAALRDKLACAARSSAQRFTPDKVVAAWDEVVYAAARSPA